MNMYAFKYARDPATSVSGRDDLSKLHETPTGNYPPAGPLSAHRFACSSGIAGNCRTSGICDHLLKTVRFTPM